MNMPIGMIILLVVGVLVYFGIAHRLLDRMRLTDKQALLFIGAIVVGSFFDITVMRTPVEVSVNVGGALLPAILAVWLILKADETAEKVRAIVASILVAAAVWLGSRYLPYEPENMFLDPKLMYGVTAGLIAYLAGRSRRSAFIGGVLGIVLSDVVHMVTIVNMGIPGKTDIGGAGPFDVLIISGFVAVMIAELVGETREKLQGGPVINSDRPEGLFEFSKELGPDNKKRLNSDRSGYQKDSESKDNASAGDRGEQNE